MTREEALLKLHEYMRFIRGTISEKYYGEALNVAIKALEEPERKTGRWILHENQRQEDVDNGNYLYICSECGKSDLHAKTQEVPFCWWCGCKMEGA